MAREWANNHLWVACSFSQLLVLAVMFIVLEAVTSKYRWHLFQGAYAITPNTCC
jgi:hypothetical protein